MQKVPQAGYNIEGLWISGMYRRITYKNLLLPLKLVSSMWKARRILKKFKPDLAIGTGGFASGPLMKAAAIKGIKYVLQEQNSFPGITNRMLGKKAEKIFVAYGGLERFFHGTKLIKTGNPVREDLFTIDAKREEAKQFFNLKEDKKTLLITGGSLGARRINDLIETELDFFKKFNMQLIWQCGKFYYEEYKRCEGNDVQVHAYLDRMDLAYAAADFIISRSGAGAVSELFVVGKPVIFIPSPYVAENHQHRNATAVSDKNAAIMVGERELDTDFRNEFYALLSSEKRQEQISRNIKKMALPKAAERIVDEIAVILEKK